MSTWDVASPSTPSSPATPVQQIYGRDLFYDVSDASGANLKVTPSGDWLAVDGADALRQWVVRCIITNPGEWATLPDFGAGARQFVKARNTRTNRDALTERLRAQLVRNPRVQKIDSIVVKQTDDGGLIIAVAVIARGQDQRALPVVVTVAVG